MSLDVCVVGEINPDLILYGVPEQLKPEEESLINGFRLTLGSSSAIFAHNLAVLGTRVGMVSKIGADSLGKMAFDWLADAGVDLTRVRVASSGLATGLSVILAQPSHRFILTYPGTMFAFSHADLDLDYIFSARHLHLSSYFLHKALRPHIADLFREAKAKGLSTSLDTNDDPEGKWGSDLLDVLPFVDIFFPNEREAKKVAGTDDLPQAIERLAQLCQFVVVKLGRAWSHGTERRRRMAPCRHARRVGGSSRRRRQLRRRFHSSLPAGRGPRRNASNTQTSPARFQPRAKVGPKSFKDHLKVEQFFREHITSRQA